MRLLELYVSTECIDLVCITETWANENVNDAFYSMNDRFRVVRHDRSDGRKGGGVLLLIRRELRFSVVKVNSVDGVEIAAIDLLLRNRPGKRIVVGYRPPAATAHTTRNVFSEVCRLVGSSHSCIICGDFNLPTANWSNLTGIPDDVACDLVAYGLTQLVSEPTCGENILDAIFASDETACTDISVSDAPFKSDHRLISFVIPVSEHLGTSHLLERNYIKADFPRIKHLLEAVK
jgi:hypothetical protein